MRNLLASFLFLQLLLIPIDSLCATSVPPGAGGIQLPAQAGPETKGNGAAAAVPLQEAQPTRPDGALQLRGEPGDAEILLNWYTTEQGSGTPVSFTVSYRSEQEQAEKKLEQIRESRVRLRGLVNNQLYFIEVSGYGANGQLVATSEQLTLAPLPADQLISPLERSFAAGALSIPSKGVRREVRQFGYDFFNNSGAASQDNIPVGADYVVGPGDALRIDLWGALQARYELEVDRNGEIAIPRVGPVKVWGLSYSQLHPVLDKAVSRYFKGHELNVTLGKLRSIQVFVVGEVHAPGAYTVSSLASAINALSAAGGPSKNGSLRQVRLLRGGKLIQEIDLYAMFLTGDRSRDLRVENGDTLFVPVIGPVAAVAGEVKRPAIYELNGETSLSSLIEMAGGIGAAGDKGRIQVERLEGNSARVILDHLPREGELLQELSRVAVSDRDLVKVFPFYDEARGVVTLSGNVTRPGQYQYREGMTLRDLIPDYGALLPESYLGAVEVMRLELPDRHREKLSVNLGKALEGDSKENLALREKDQVKVFSLWQMQERPMVSVSGQVVKPGRYPFYPQMTVRDLLTEAGSLKRNALLSSAELTRVEVRDGAALSTRVNLDLNRVLAADPGANLTLQPDDMLIVRGITQWLEASDRLVTLSGEVRYPGSYSIAKGERLSSVIARAGGFTERAYLRGARFTRESVREMQQKRMDEVIAKSEREIMKKQAELPTLASSSEDLQATRLSLDLLMKSLEKLKQARAEGRIVLRLKHPEELSLSEYDLALTGGDHLEVPLTPSVVNVLGQVYNPTTFVYRERNNVASYLRDSGGPLPDAEECEMYIVRADGIVAGRQSSSLGWDEPGGGWNWGGFTSRSLLPGDTLVVPQKLERIAWLREIKDITTIVSQVALTAGTIFLFFK